MQEDSGPTGYWGLCWFNVNCKVGDRKREEKGIGQEKGTSLIIRPEDGSRGSFPLHGMYQLESAERGDLTGTPPTGVTGKN